MAHAMYSETTLDRGRIADRVTTRRSHCKLGTCPFPDDIIPTLKKQNPQLKGTHIVMTIMPIEMAKRKCRKTCRNSVTSSGQGTLFPIPLYIVDELHHIMSRRR